MAVSIGLFCSHYCDSIHKIKNKKEADWSIAEHAKVRWESQPENAGRKKGGTRGISSRCKEKQDGHAVLEKVQDTW